MDIQTVFFDLDGTLYSDQNGLWSAIKQRIDRFLLERMGMTAATAARLRQEYLETYGTTLRGLQIHYQVNPDEYLGFVHDLPLEQYLQFDPALDQMLAELQRPHWVLTNSNSEHAERVLRLLGIRQHFAELIDIRALEFFCKPLPEAYQRALNLAGVTNPRTCLLIEDSPRNLAPARELGFSTVLVSQDGAGCPADFTIPTIHALREVLPELWTAHN